MTYNIIKREYMKIVILLCLSFNLSANEDCTSIDNDIARLACYDENAKNSPIVDKKSTGERDYIAEARESVVKNFKDPDSAKFRNEVIYHNSGLTTSHHKGVCGEVNSKNSYGAYTGFKRYYYSFGEAGASTEGSKSTFDIFWDIVCQNKE